MAAMMRLQARVSDIAAIAAMFVLGACSHSPVPELAPVAPPPMARVAPSPAAMPPAALQVEGLPPLPVALLQEVQRYDRVAGHVFVDWHPVLREMLVAHRPPEADTTQIYRLRAPGASLEALTEGSEPVTRASWEPRSGRYIVFARGPAGHEAHQLYRLDPDSRQVTQITAPGQRHSLLGWVRGKGLAVVASLPLDPAAAAGAHPEVTTTISLIDPMQPGGARKLVELPGSAWSRSEVSPDDRQIAMARSLSATESEIWLIDLGNGQRRRLLPTAGEPQWARHWVGGWSRDGRALFITSDRASEFKELMRLDLARSTLTRLSDQTPWDSAWGGNSTDGRSVAIVVNADGRQELRLLDSLTGLARSLPPLPPGSVTAADFHPALNELAFDANSAQAPSRIHTIDMGTGQVTAWTQTVGTEGLSLHTLPDQQIVRWKSFDGRTISGILTLPPVRFKGPRPVVMAMHGGPESQARLGWKGRTNYLAEQLGVAVLEPNVRGSSGYGKTFLDLDNGRLREDSVKDMAAAIDWISTQPALDVHRVLVMGSRHGGYMALAASTLLADRIAGAISVGGISNFVSFLQTSESERRDLRRAEYGDERDPTMRSFLHAISPLTHAERISKPLLVVQGKADPRVAWMESEQIVRSLQQRGQPVWYLLAHDEDHGFVRRENASFCFAAMVHFIGRTLRP
jgi:dipeptidyl aminopeptidase/acylaminoacyl peptidase